VGRERLALNQLALREFHTYYPVIRAQKRAPDGRRFEGSAGLFGVYGFVLIQSRWYDARWSPGVSSMILGADGRPAKVGDEVIASLRAREDENGFIKLEKQRPEFMPGDRLRIVQGPFAGQICLFEGMSSRQRIDVLLVLLGAERRASLAKADVRTLRAPAGP
jgi:transcriptional antiterminator RfaH